MDNQRVMIIGAAVVASVVLSIVVNGLIFGTWIQGIGPGIGFGAVAAIMAWAVLREHDAGRRPPADDQTTEQV